MKHSASVGWWAPLACLVTVLVPSLLATRSRAPDGGDDPRFFTDRDGRPLSLPDEAAMFGFAVYGDRTGGPPEGVAVLAQAVTETNLLAPDLVMTVGDLVQGYNKREPWLEQMREFRSIMDRLDCPWFPVAGNHDIYWRGAGRPAGEHESDYSEHFGPLWYCFEHKQCGFVVLYSDEGNPATGERSISDPAAQQMSSEQLAFLDAALERCQSLRHVFVFLHHPRWIADRYGDGWEKVHARLAAASNVRVVFGGHIHRMRYDGSRDGIEYVTLATTGGDQSGLAARAGYLHHYLWVTVREDGVDFAALPIGELLDVRAITGTVSEDAEALAGASPRTRAPLAVAADGSCEGDLQITLTNPASEPIEVTGALECADPAWILEDARRTARIDPGATAEWRFSLHRSASTWRLPADLPEIALETRWTGARWHFDLRPRRCAIAYQPDLGALPRPESNLVLHLDGKDSCARVHDEALALPDGPFTLEGWLDAESFGERTGFLNKTESSEFGLFVDGGVPSFLVFLGDRYVTVRSATPLSAHEWHHLAGVFDGRALRLYLDGRLVGSELGSGTRRRNALPLLIGADVDADGRPTSALAGSVDSVRISSVARYTAPFTPERDPSPDEHTVFLADMTSIGPWLADRSRHAAHADLVATARCGPEP